MRRTRTIRRRMRGKRGMRRERRMSSGTRRVSLLVAQRPLKAKVLEKTFLSECGHVVAKSISETYRHAQFHNHKQTCVNRDGYVSIDGLSQLCGDINLLCGFNDKISKCLSSHMSLVGINGSDSALEGAGEALSKEKVAGGGYVAPWCGNSLEEWSLSCRR